MKKKRNLTLIQELNNNCETGRIFSILLALRLGIEHNRLYHNLKNVTLKKNYYKDLSDEKIKQLSKAHLTIVMHVNNNDKLNEQILHYKKWCKKSYNNRKILEDLIEKFEIEMNHARDAIWSQSLKNKNMQQLLTQISSDQVNASEVSAQLLQRLQISELRRVELEARFSTLARASTPLMNEIRSIQNQNFNNQMSTNESITSFNHQRGSESDLSETTSHKESDDDGSSFSSSSSYIYSENDSNSNYNWQSPYLMRKGLTIKNEMNITMNAKLQKETLLHAEELDLLNPSSNHIFFIGANQNTNVMSVMLLKQKGYSIETVSNLNEIKLNKIDSSKIDLVIIDLNVIRLSVDYVMRILGSNDMLGKQMFNRDIPVVALSTHSSQRMESSKHPGMYFVLKPPKPGPFDLVIRSALARYYNLNYVRDKKKMEEWSPTPDDITDHLYINLNQQQGIDDQLIELNFANPKVQRPASLALPFPETPTPPRTESRSRKTWSRSSADSTGNMNRRHPSPYPPSTPKSSRRTKSSRENSKLKLNVLRNAEELLSNLQMVSV